MQMHECNEKTVIIRMNALSNQNTGCSIYSRLVSQSRVDFFFFIVLKLTERVEVELLNC